jgi:hypothetical protein
MSKQRECADCGEPVEGRRRYCDEHQQERRQRTKLVNRIAHGETYNDNRRQKRAAQAQPAEVIAQDMIDYREGGGHRNPRELLARAVRQPEPEPDVVDYTPGGQQRPSIYAPRQRVHGGQRQGGFDMTGAAMDERQERVVDWSDLESVSRAYEQPAGHTVDIRSMLSPAANQPRYDNLGRPMPRSRNRSRNGLR